MIVCIHANASVDVCMYRHMYEKEREGDEEPTQKISWAHICIYVCMYACIHISICTHAYAHIHTKHRNIQFIHNSNLCIHTCTHVYMHHYISVHILYIHTHTYIYTCALTSLYTRKNECSACSQTFLCSNRSVVHECVSM